MKQTRAVRALILRVGLALAIVASVAPATSAAPIAAVSRVPVHHAASERAQPVPITAPATCGTGDPRTVTGSCTVTINALDFPTGAPLANFNYIISVDNTKLPSDPLALSTESNSPNVRIGNQDRTSFTLPDGRYLVSVRSTDHKMWGAYFTLPNDAAEDGTLTLPVSLTVQSADNPLPLGKIRVFVFNDNTWTNGAPDTEEAGLTGFHVTLDDQINTPVQAEYDGAPLCTLGNTGEQASCHTAADGFLQINDLGPATYFIEVTPPTGPCNSDPNSEWRQTTTIDGGFTLLASVEEGSDGTGSPGEQLWEAPNNRTAYWFGFVCSPKQFAVTTGTGEIVGTARNWVEWAPYTTGTFGDPVENPFVALSDSATDQTIYVGQGDAAGNFDIQNVPPGSYNLSIWDEQLSYIMRFKPVDVAAGQTVDMNDTGDDGSIGIGVSRWFGWLDGTVYKDLNNNGKYDACAPGQTPGPTTCDTVLPNTDMDNRWRDGSIKDVTFTDAQGHYEYPIAEGGALGRWFINEQGFARFSAYPGASLHDEHTGAVTPSCAVDPPAVPANPCIPTDQGGGLLTNQKLLEGHRATVDWGKRDYPAGTPGQIVGITYFATTRNEFDARFAFHEDYEAAIPDVTVYLEGLGPDGLPNTADDVILNKYVTDHWQQPSAGQDPQPGGNTFTQNCKPIRDLNGVDITGQFNPDIGPNCLEVPLGGQSTKDGAFDGGYAFADYCPNGYDLAADNGTCNGGGDPVPLIAGTYVTHVIMPTDPTDTRDCNQNVVVAGGLNVSSAKGAIPGGGGGCLYHTEREEDVNVDLGNQFAPAVPPPACTGDLHAIDQSTLTPRSPYYTGDQSTSPSQPLCDKRLVVLQNQQNANADFFLVTNFRNDPNRTDPNDTHTGDVAEPGRVIGQVFDDIYFERNPLSNWYGEPRPIANIPIGVYARVDTVPNVNLPYDANNWRLIKTLTTGPDGTYEILLPSTETFNCPIPQGPCPGMYIVIVDDPGTKAHPNANYNPNLLTANTPFEVWPGLTTQLDTPIDPIAGTACEDPAVPARPELLQVSRPYVNAGDGGVARQITIFGDFIGTAGPANATGGRILLTDVRTGVVTTLNRSAGGGIVSWTPGAGSVPDTIVVQIPAINTTNFRPGPKQLTIVTANANGAVSSVNGITIHVLGSNGTGGNQVTYNPPIVTVAPPPPAAGGDAHALQNAIDTAAPGSLLVLSPGTYNENVLLWKPLKLQGLGPGGVIGAHELAARDPEDPRFNISGSIIDGRFFQQNATAYDASVAAHAPYALANAPLNVVLRGADLTVVAQSTTAFDLATGAAGGILSAARIDGLGLMTGHGDGAGGLELQANANNMQITNDVLENNGGIFAGGIGLGQPFARNSHNYNVRMANDRLIGNGGLTTSGGIGIFYGSNNYEVANSIVCSNFSVEYGAGISHIGLSPNGSIHDNQIYYNDSVDSGAGIAIESELPQPPSPGALGDGSGAVNVDRNLLQSNYSGDDGGAIFVLDALDQPINIRNNMIVDNGASDLGGAIMLDDASKVAIVNNTVSDNVTTASAESSAIGVPHAAGLAAEANETSWQTDARYAAQYPNAGTRPDFSNPVALFNNIFWDNDAFTLDQFGPGATLVDQGFIDFEVHGTTNNADTFTPRYSDLTNGNILGPNGVQHPVPAGQANISADPLFVTPFILELTVSGARLDPQQAAVTITGADPPVGLTGDYHITAGSPVVDRGAGFSDLTVPAPATQTPSANSILAPCSGTLAQNYPADFDRQLRPQIRSLRVRTLWDMGADELPGLRVPIPFLPGFNWNNAGHPLCSASTVPNYP